MDVDVDVDVVDVVVNVEVVDIVSHDDESDEIEGDREEAVVDDATRLEAGAGAQEMTPTTVSWP